MENIYNYNNGNDYMEGPREGMQQMDSMQQMNYMNQMCMNQMNCMNQMCMCMCMNQMCMNQMNSMHQMNCMDGPMPLPEDNQDTSY